MTDVTGTNPIGDDELVFRRVPVSEGRVSDASVPLASRVSPAAFAPHKVRDDTGISVNRSKFSTIEQSAIGTSKQGYYVAVLKVSDLRRSGIEIVYCPLPENVAHCEIPALKAETRDSIEAETLKVLLASLVIDVAGPFQTPAS